MLGCHRNLMLLSRLWTTTRRFWRERRKGFGGFALVTSGTRLLHDHPSYSVEVAACERDFAFVHYSCFFCPCSSIPPQTFAVSTNGKLAPPPTTLR